MDNLITLEVNERRQVTTDYVVITIHLIVQHKNRHMLIKRAQWREIKSLKMTTLHSYKQDIIIEFEYNADCLNDLCNAFFPVKNNSRKYYGKMNNEYKNDGYVL